MSTAQKPHQPAHAGRATDHQHAAAGSGTNRYQELKNRIHTKAVDLLKPEEMNKLPEEMRRREICRVVERLIASEEHLLNATEQRQLFQELIDDILGLGPLERLLRDPRISDILVNGPHQAYVERAGVLEEAAVDFRDNDYLLEIIHRIVARVGRRVDEQSPMVDARLPDGSRVNAIIPPLALRGPTLSIRRFGLHPLRLPDLLRLKALTPEISRLLEAYVKARINIIVSGGTGSGKTTLLNALSAFIPSTERIITIEDAAELQLQQTHVVQLEARPPNLEGKGAVTIRDLVRNSLRMRPNRIIVGECRGAEVLDMLQAMNTGHEGSMSTLHSNSPRDALGRLEMMFMMTELDLPLQSVRQLIAAAINVIIQVDRLPGGARRITRVTELTGMEQDVITLQDVFVYRQLGVDGAGKAFGQFEATGVRSRFMPRIEAAGVHLPPDLFKSGVLLNA